MRIESRRTERAPLVLDETPEFLASGTLAAGEYRCADCGYGVIVRVLLPACPMCKGVSWEQADTARYDGSAF